MHLYLLWAIYGWGISTWLLMRVIWLPDPPPNWLGSYIVISAAGILGGVGGGMIAALVNSDPVPGVVGAFTGALVLAGLARAVMGKSASAA